MEPRAKRATDAAVTAAATALRIGKRRRQYDVLAWESHPTDDNDVAAVAAVVVIGDATAAVTAVAAETARLRDDSLAKMEFTVTRQKWNSQSHGDNSSSKIRISSNSNSSSSMDSTELNADDDDSDSSDTISNNNNNEDHLTLIVRERSGGSVLIVALLLSGCLLLNSALILMTPPPLSFSSSSLLHRTTNNDTVVVAAAAATDTAFVTELPLYTGHCFATASHPIETDDTVPVRQQQQQSTSSPPPPPPVLLFWRQSMEQQVIVLTNLIHAALLVATAVVVSVRGDLVWLYFLHYTVLLWTMVSVVYAGATLFVHTTTGTSTAPSVWKKQEWIDVSVMVAFALCSTYLLIQYSSTSRRIRIVQQQHEQQQQQKYDYRTEQARPGKDQQSSLYHDHSRWARQTLWWGSVAIQVGMGAYFLATTVSWWNSLPQQPYSMHGQEMIDETLLSLWNTTLTNGSSNANRDCDEEPFRSLHEVMTAMNSNITAGHMNGATAMTTTSGSDGSSSSRLLPFVMAYSETAHTSFVLALIHLAAMYPDQLSCVAACLLAVSWRLLISMASLLHILFWRSAPTTLTPSSTRDAFSLIFTTLDVVTLIPIVAAAVWLYILLLRRRGQWTDAHCSAANNDDDDDAGVVHVHSGALSVAPVPSLCNDTDQVELGAVVEKDGLMMMTTTIATTTDKEEPAMTFRCLTAAQIAASTTDCFDRRQIWGASLLSFGCTALLVEMTLESMLLLSQTMVGSDATHDVYKWGMHSCVMYLFCTTMSIESSSVYQRARWLLCVACPMGSIVALWQLTPLLTLVPTSVLMNDAGTLFFAILLAVRALSGLLQTIGVVLLDHTEPKPSLRGNTDVITDRDQQHDLEKAHAQASRALFAVFLPSLVAYVATSTLSGNCMAPMISPMFPLASDVTMGFTSSTTSPCDMLNPMNMPMDLMLMQNIPGLGLFFHFGLVVVIFTYLGLQRNVPSYAPSLAFAALSTGHVGLLTLVSLFWDVGQTQGWSSLSSDDVVRRVVLLVWSLSSGYLSCCLNRLWRLRVELME